MPYDPSVNDNSGQILAGYQTRSADIKAAGNEALAKGIMDGAISAIGGIAGAYQQTKMQAAGGKAFKDFMGVAGPSMGISNEQLKMFKSMNDQDAYQMSQMFMPVAPSMVSANTWAPRAAMQNQNAIYQNQVPANQQPISTGGAGTAPAASSMGGIDFNHVK
jgi:hypothetical protein